MHYLSKHNKSVIIILKLMFIKQVGMNLTIDSLNWQGIQV